MVAGIRLGVDLGTSNTVAVLRWPDGRSRPLLFDGSPQLPSAVYADPSGAVLVGRDAVHHARVHPDRFERNPKRRIDDGTVLLGEAELAVVDLLAAVLRQVHTEAVRVGGRPPAEVVLTHPVDWGTRRRATLAQAATRAGLAAVRLVPEPVAAAGYFMTVLRHQLPVGGHLVVYDFGAGTFDATVVRRTATSMEVLAADGVADAGGLDIDAAVVDYLGEVLAERDEAGWQRLISPASSADRRLSQQFWDDVRGAKEMLSRAPSAIVHVPVLDTDAPVGREQLERFARPVLDRTVLATQAAIRAAAVAPSEISGVFLVGGSSRIPLVATLLHRSLQIAPTTLEQPEMVVAEGSLCVPGAPVAAPPGPVAPVPHRPPPGPGAAHRPPPAPAGGHRPVPPGPPHAGPAAPGGPHRLPPAAGNGRPGPGLPPGGPRPGVPAGQPQGSPTGRPAAGPSGHPGPSGQPQGPPTGRPAAGPSGSPGPSAGRPPGAQPAGRAAGAPPAPPPGPAPGRPAGHRPAPGPAGPYPAASGGAAGPPAGHGATVGRAPVPAGGLAGGEARPVSPAPPVSGAPGGGHPISGPPGGPPAMGAPRPPAGGAGPAGGRPPAAPAGPRPILLTLPAATGHTLDAGPPGGGLPTAGGQLLVFRRPEPLLAHLRAQPGGGALSRLRPDQLGPGAAVRYDYLRLGRILAAACPPESIPLHRAAGGQFVPVSPDPAGAAAPADLARHVDFARLVFTRLGRRSPLLEPGRVQRATAPVLAVAGPAGRLDARVLGALPPADRFRAASWWWQLVDEFTLSVAWR